MKKIYQQIGALLFLLTLTSCTQVPTFSETALQQAQSVQAASVALIDQANTPYSGHQTEVEAVLKNAQEATDSEKLRPHNSQSTQQWAAMIDPNKNMLAGFFKKWKTDGKLSTFFIGEAKTLISNGFDQIIALENAKKTTPSN